MIVLGVIFFIPVIHLLIKQYVEASARRTTTQSTGKTEK